MINAPELVGSHDLLFITLDTLRYDATCQAWDGRRTPNLAGLFTSWGEALIQPRYPQALVRLSHTDSSHGIVINWLCPARESC